MSGRDAPTGARFASAAATGQDWRTTVKACLDKLGPVDGCNLGFLYVSDALAADAVSIVTLMRGVPASRNGSVLSASASAPRVEELFDQPAIAVMAAQLPPGSFHPAGSDHGEHRGLRAGNRRVAEDARAGTGACPWRPAQPPDPRHHP